MMHRFDERKALNVALYLIPKVGGEYNDVLVTLYLANKLHLSRYGRTIVSDTYEHGIGGLSMVAMLSDISGVLTDGQPIVRSRNTIWDSKLVTTAEPDMQFLSISDREALDDAIEMSNVLSDQGLRYLGDGEGNALHDVVRKAHPDLPIKVGAALIAPNVTEADVARTMRVGAEMVVEHLNGCD